MTTSDLPSYALERVFDAPRQMVWRTWTEADLLARWYGPNVETIVHRLDVNPGGLWLNEMRMGGASSFQRTEFTEVTPPERLVCLMSNATADWEVTPNPRMPDWPRTLLTVVTFEDLQSKTKMLLSWTPHAATPAEITCFAQMMDNMGKGWDAGMKLLAQVLAELQSN